ncbi:MAG TPA: hypothetical protein VGP63_08555 [Planctomycetaceae bacterium]|jgi:hypothetical protein|nr:hypothetical protein [Planctomycetaceae bacterium]
MTDRPLDREEYIEQAYCFRAFRERLEDNLPSQEILGSLSEELLATTNLPKAMDFLRGEILHNGRLSPGMARLGHYFTPFQTFVMSRAEEERSRFDQKTALLVLERIAEYLAGNPTPAGLFIYQFECIARNRLGYERGMKAIADDPYYDKHWRDWILKVRLRLGSTDFAQLIYYRSEQYVEERRKRNAKYKPSYAILFGVKEGRIAKANRGKDPLYMFAALQRQLGHPAVPRVRAVDPGPIIHPALEQRLQRIETRLKILDSEVKGEFNLSEFYVKPEATVPPEK